MSSQREEDPDIDPIIEELCKPIKDLKKNFEVNIQEYLDKYMYDVHTKIEVDGQTLNFSQAAMLLQGSVGCYGKKVDFLHQNSMKVLQLIGKGQGAADASGGEGGDVSGRRRRGDTDFNSDFVLLEIERGKNIEKKEQNLDHRAMEKRLGFIHHTPRELIEKEGQDPSLMKVDLFYGPKFELLGAKKDFRMNSQFSMALATFGERLTLSTAGEPEELNVTVENINFQNNNANSEVGPDMEGSEPDEPNDVDCHDDDPIEEAPPDDDGGLPVVAEEEFAMEVDDADDDGELNVSERAARQVQRGGERELLADAPPPLPIEEEELEIEEEEENLWEPCNIFERTGVKECRRGNVFRLPPLLRAKLKEAKGKKAVGKKITTISDFFNNTDEPILSKYPELADYIYTEQQRIKQFFKGRRSQNNRHKRGAPEFRVEEGLWDGEEDNHDDRGPDNDPADDDDGIEDYEPLPAFNFPDPHIGGEIGPVLNLNEMPDDQISGSSEHSYEDLVVKMVDEFVQKSRAWVASTELAKKVNAWHEMIGPRLETVEKRSAFDIHKYGSEILDNFQTENRITSVPFKEVVANKSREEISRYFLSSLMLANCMNVEIVSGGNIDDMQLKLLTTRRHHEQLEEFQAASQMSTSSQDG